MEEEAKIRDSQIDLMKKRIEDSKDLSIKVGDLTSILSPKVEQNRLGVQQMGTLLPEISSLTYKLFSRIDAEASDFRAAARRCKRHQLATLELSRLFRMPELAELDPEDTYIEEIHQLNKTTVSLKFYTDIIPKDSVILAVSAFDHWANHTDPVPLRYDGPKFVVRNYTSGCIQGIDEPNYRTVSVACLRQNFTDPNLNSWVEIHPREAGGRVVIEPQVFKTSTVKHVYCMDYNVTVNGQSIMCPPYAFSIPLQTSFETAGHMHNGSFSTVVISGNAVPVDDVLLNSTDHDEDYDREVRLVHGIRGMKEKLNEPLPLGYTRGALTIPIPEMTWGNAFYAIGIVGSIITIARCAHWTWGRRQRMPDWALPLFFMNNRQPEIVRESAGCAHGCTQGCLHRHHKEEHPYDRAYPNLHRSSLSLD